MLKLTDEQMADLSGRIAQELFNANMEGKLFYILHRMGLDYLLDEMPGVETGNPMGKIMVIGALAASQEQLLGVAKNIGFKKERFRFLDYEEAKSYNYSNLQYSRTFCLVLIGPAPHKTTGTNDSRSLVSELENHPDIYPHTKRLAAANGELKISKSNFRTALEELIHSGVICPDVCDAVAMKMIA